MSAIAFLAGLGSGYLDEQDKQKALARQSKLDQITLDDAAARKTERDRVIADRDALRAAAAPVPVTEDAGLPETMDNRDVGQPGEPAAKVYRVGAQQFAQQGVAQQAADAQRRTRMQGVMDAQDPVGAPGRELQGLQISAAKREAANKQWDDDLNAAFSSPDPLNSAIKFMNDSHADGAGGTIKTKPIISPDGKTFTVARVNPDGTEVRVPMQPMPNNPEGWNQLQLALSKNVPLQAKLAHYQQVNESARKGKVDEAEIKLKGAQAGHYEGLNGTKLDAAGIRAGAGGGKSAYDRMSEVDKVQLQSLNKQIETIDSEITKAQAGNMWDDASPNAKALKTRRATMSLKAQQLVSQYGDEAAPDPAGIRSRSAGATSTTTRPQTSMEQVQADMRKTGVTDARIQLTGQPEMRVGGAAPVAKPSAATIAQAGVAPAPAAPPAAAPAPTFAQRPTGDAALNTINSENLATMKPLNDAVAQASAQLAVVAKSGDPVALQRYATALTQARAARDTAAQQRFGNRAREYLASVSQ